MGVDGLHKFISKNCPNAVRIVNISELRGRSCVIDGMQHVYSQLIYMRARNKEVITNDGKNISHIHGLINSLKYYLKYEIIPIFVFDGKSPDIKKKKIEERKKTLRDNLQKMKELDQLREDIEKIMEISEKQNLKKIKSNDTIETEVDNNPNFMNELIYGTPPTESYLNKYAKNAIGEYTIDEINNKNNANKISEINEEYKKIYKKSILFKDYFIIDWIEIIEFLGLPVIKAEGEADPLCAYILKYNPNVYGIISDDSDMLIFGSPILMRKAKNQNFSIIRLENLVENINKMLSDMYNKDIDFKYDDLVNFSILLGTDYGTINLKENINDSMDVLMYYIDNDKDYKKIIEQEQIEEFNIIKKYYTESENTFERKYDDFLMKPTWNKPKLMELKHRLLELDVDEDYIDETNMVFSNYYKGIKNSKTKKKKIDYEFQNKYNKHVNDYKFSDLFSGNIGTTINSKNKIIYDTNNLDSDNDSSSDISDTNSSTIESEVQRDSEDFCNEDLVI